MCWIATYNSRDKYTLANDVKDAATYNSDGYSLVYLDYSDESRDTILRTMSLDTLLAVLTTLPDTGRVFVHLRAATTDAIGVLATHAFDDCLRKIIMHNGIISNAAGYAVDSHNLLDTKYDFTKENYVNAFFIDTEARSYRIIRQVTGSLYTDNTGNYSTTMSDLCLHQVKQHTDITHEVADDYLEEDFERDYFFKKGSNW